MAGFIEETNVRKIAKALIVNHGFLWVLVCGGLKHSTRHLILEKVRAFGIDPESKLYQDIEHSICTKEEINDRCTHYRHNILICDLDGLINETITADCVMTCIKTIQR